MSAFGQLAEICCAALHFGFTPDIDRESGLPAKGHVCSISGSGDVRCKRSRQGDVDDSSLAMLGCRARQSDRGKHSREHAVATGTVKWFNPTKGYGFIQPQSGGKDVFVHISALERAGLSTLNEGATVDYEIVSDRGKESAGNLKVR